SMVTRRDSHAHTTGITAAWAMSSLSRASTKERDPGQSARGCQYFQLRYSASKLPRMRRSANSATIAGASAGVEARIALLMAAAAAFTVRSDRDKEFDMG